LQNNPSLDRLVVQQNFRILPSFASLKRIAQLRKLSGADFDLAFFMHTDLSAILPALFVRARFKVGYDDNDCGFDFPFTHSAGIYHGDHPRRWELLPRHVNSQMHDLLGAVLGFSVIEQPPELFLDKREINEMAELLRLQGLSRPLVALAIGGSQSHKLWPLEHFVKLAQTCAREYGFSVLVLGGAEDSARAAHMAWPQEHFYFAAGALTLRQSFCCTSLADAVFGADTGLIHAAHALGTRTVAVFGPTSATAYGYSKDGASVLHADLSCVPCAAVACQLLPAGSREPPPCMVQVGVTQSATAIERAIATRPQTNRIGAPGNVVASPKENSQGHLR
jgi:ADP-heptose:LPS heptosyltransferase